MKSQIVSGATLRYRNSADALKIIVHENYGRPDFVKEGKEAKNEDGDRIFSGPETGNWWIDIQVSFV